MNKTTLVALLLSGFLGVIYLGLMPAAGRGYGYMGYHGYHRGPSFWYWGGPSTYHNRDIRRGSLGGGGFRGGGPGSGK